jgi:hypothetical protein
MLDIRTLLLLTPEDCYSPNPALRQAEVLVFPLLASASGERSVGQAARPEEVMA